MGILNNFKREMNRLISVYPKEQGFDISGRIVEEFADTPKYTDIKAAVWYGSTAEKFVSGRYKGKIDAVAVMIPGYDIPTGSKIIVDGALVFYSIPQDDIMCLGEVLVIGLQNGV